MMAAKRDRNDKAKWHTAQAVLSVTGTKFMNCNQGKAAAVLPPARNGPAFTGFTGAQGPTGGD